MTTMNAQQQQQAVSGPSSKQLHRIQQGSNGTGASAGTSTASAMTPEEEMQRELRRWQQEATHR